MQLTNVVKALGTMCLMLTDGFPVLQDKPPEIIGPQRVQVHVRLGETTLLHCDAFANCDSDETLIYWITNKSFPEDTLNSDRIVESDESTMVGGAIVHRSLLLRSITSEDLNSTFTCVVSNPLGIVKKCFQLTSHDST
ncbi:interleukin-1 receptor type 2-like isoform X2 [Gouania willdenowi]|nr:interleukin-1 receptor type 2-like isoform X2 [Gouania willdenowi]